MALDESHYNALLRAHVENGHEFSPSEFLAWSVQLCSDWLYYYFLWGSTMGQDVSIGPVAPGDKPLVLLGVAA